MVTWLLVIIECRVVSRTGGPGGQVLTGHGKGGGHAPHPHHVPHVSPAGHQGAQLSAPTGTAGAVPHIPGVRIMSGNYKDCKMPKSLNCQKFNQKSQSK